MPFVSIDTLALILKGHPQNSSAPHSPSRIYRPSVLLLTFVEVYLVDIGQVLHASVSSRSVEGPEPVRKKWEMR